MSRPPLHIVADERPRTETVAQKVRRLQAEAKALAAAHLAELVEQMAATEALAAEIAVGGGAYHPGAQERARRIADEVKSQRLTLEQIIGGTR